MHNYITVAPTGARRTKQDHPNLPMTLGEIAQTAQGCYAAGAGQIHLHVRDNTGAHSLDVGRYRETMQAINALAPQMKIQITTEAAGFFEPQDQLDCLGDLAPKAASVAIREMAKAPKIATRLYAQAQEVGTNIQHILYNTGDIDHLIRWRRGGIVPEGTADVLFVLGKYHPMVLAKPADLAPFLTAIKDQDMRWAVCAFGRAEPDCALLALSQGGRIRIGFENNFRKTDGMPYARNEDSIAHVLALARAQESVMNFQEPAL